MMKMDYPLGSLVWARIGTNWWPGTVTDAENCPQEFMKSLKKEPLLIVKFFNEQDYFDIHKQDTVLPYNCSRKDDLIKKGLSSLRHDSSLLGKYEEDVLKAEKLSGGNANIIKELRDSRKRKIIDYADMGFGIPKPRKAPKDESMQKQGFSNIGKAVEYKKGFSHMRHKQKIEHQVRILEQPKVEDDMKTESSWYKCDTCGYTCVRLNVIIWHNKSHLKTVADYDSGIRIPGKRKRKQQTPRSRSSKKQKVDVVNDAGATNGHNSSTAQGAKELLLDWEDDDEEMAADPAPITDPSNGVEGDKSDEEAPVQESNNKRQPMPDQKDINSAFDALLAESSTSHIATGSTDNYANNDSDSDCSDWEKYYDNTECTSPASKNSGLSNVNGVQNGEQSPPLPDEEVAETAPEKCESLSPKEELPSDEQCSEEKSSGIDSVVPQEKTASLMTSESKASLVKENEPVAEKKETTTDRESGKETVASPPVAKTNEQNVAPKSTEKPHSTPSTGTASSGPAYMLVAVDAQGNNVPMPVLSEGGNNLVAVEASMEDGTTRTLYIDPAHLGPNVDLNNLMLHIDNSGEETVYIASASSEGEAKDSKTAESST